MVGFGEYLVATMLFAISIEKQGQNGYPKAAIHHSKTIGVQGIFHQQSYRVGIKGI